MLKDHQYWQKNKYRKFGYSISLLITNYFIFQHFFSNLEIFIKWSLFLNIANMSSKSKKISLMVLGVTAIICSRMLFFFFNDPEGPNLLIVAALAMAIYFLSFVAYVFVPSKMKELKKVSVVVCVQILSVIGLYFCMK